MIPYGRHDVSQADINAVISVLRSDWLTQGPMVPRFERGVADFTGAAHAVASNSATSSLHVACLALGVGPGDRVWTSPNTFVASANCALYCGAEVDFVDIDPCTYNLSVERLSEKLATAKINGTLPKVVIPVHFAGQPCDMLAIHALGREYGFRIIEDASHAIGAKYKGEAVGNCRYSDITVFSFHPVKIITTGEGGLATTNDEQLAQTMAELRSHGIVREPERFERPPAGPWVYEQQQLGFNYRMTDLQASLGLSQLKRLEQIVAERNRLLQMYRQILADLPVRLLEVPEDVVSAVHLAVIRLEEASSEQHRWVFEGLRSEGIGVQLHYSPVHLQPYYRQLGFDEGQLPESEAYANDAISLPLYPGLNEPGQQRVAAALASLMET